VGRWPRCLRRSHLRSTLLSRLGAGSCASLARSISPPLIWPVMKARSAGSVRWDVWRGSSSECHACLQAVREPSSGPTRCTGRAARLDMMAVVGPSSRLAAWRRRPVARAGTGWWQQRWSVWRQLVSLSMGARANDDRRHRLWCAGVCHMWHRVAWLYVPCQSRWRMTG
jgi:hypothetical protein